MGTINVFNSDLSLVIGIFFIVISLAVAVSAFILESVHLKRLIKVIDLIAGVISRGGLYDEEIVEISNILPTRLIKSTEGDFAKRYHELIICLECRGIG